MTLQTLFLGFVWSNYLALGCSIYCVNGSAVRRTIVACIARVRCEPANTFCLKCPIRGKRLRVLLILNGVLDSFVDFQPTGLISTRRLSAVAALVTTLEETERKDCRHLTCNVQFRSEEQRTVFLCSAWRKCITVVARIIDWCEFSRCYNNDNADRITSIRWR